ncbi:hypothetical protein V8E36_007529 [Tilletia maclaganii]
MNPPPPFPGLEQLGTQAMPMEPSQYAQLLNDPTFFIMLQQHQARQQQAGLGVSAPNPSAPSAATRAAAPSSTPPGFDADDPPLVKPIPSDQQDVGLKRSAESFSFNDKRRVLWTEQDAKETKAARQNIPWPLPPKKKLTIGATDVVVDFNGNKVKRSTLRSIRRLVRQAAGKEFDPETVADRFRHHVKNYGFWTTHYMNRVTKVVDIVELRFPFLSWCEDNYKTRRLLQKRLKSKAETAGKHGEGNDATSEDDDDDEEEDGNDDRVGEPSASSRKSPTKAKKQHSTTKRKSPAKSQQHSNDNKKGKKFESKKRPAPSQSEQSSKRSRGNQDEDEEDFMDWQDDYQSVLPSAGPSNAERPKPKQAFDVIDSSSEDEHAGSIVPAAGPSGFVKPTSASTKRRMLIQEDEDEDIVLATTPSKTTTLRGIQLPRRVLTPLSNTPERSNFTRSSSASIARYLDKSLRDEVKAALAQVKTATSIGMQGHTFGVDGFGEWISAIEVIPPPREVDEGSQLIIPGKDEDFGSSEQACRLLSTLLRLLALEHELKPEEKVEELHHADRLRKAALLIKRAYTPAKARVPRRRQRVRASTTRSQLQLRPRTIAGRRAPRRAASKTAVRGGSTTKTRNSVAKTLANGIVDEQVLLSLPGFAAKALCDKASIDYAPKAKVSEIKALLIEAQNNGTIDIQAEQVVMARGRLDIKGKIRVDKGKRKA